jgi:RNA polymerase sigma-70 factor (ECF subfamily)
MIYRYFFYKTGDKQLTEDLTAETFVKALINFDRFDDKKAALQTWLLALGKNIFIDNYRKCKNKVYVSDEALFEIPDITDLEKTVFTFDTYKILYKALGELSDKDRNLIALKYSSNLKNKEIASLINKSEQHTAVILSRTLTKLRKILVKMGVDSYE